MRAAQSGDQPVRGERVHRNVIVNSIFGGRRKELERAIRAGGSRPIEFGNGTWLSVKDASGGRVLEINGAKAAETVRALTENRIDRLLPGMRVAGTPVRMN